MSLQDYLSRRKSFGLRTLQYELFSLAHAYTLHEVIDRLGAMISEQSQVPANSGFETEWSDLIEHLQEATEIALKLAEQGAYIR